MKKMLVCNLFIISFIFVAQAACTECSTQWQKPSRIGKPPASEPPLVVVAHCHGEGAHHINMKKKVQGKKPAAKPCRSTPKKKPAYVSQICIEDCCWKKPGIHPAIGQASIQPQTDFSSDEDLVVPGMPALQKKTKPPQVTGYYFTVATHHDPQ